MALEVAQMALAYGEETATAFYKGAARVGINRDFAWRIGVVMGDDVHPLRQAFGRRLDAELAKRALDEAGLNTPEALLAAGWQKTEEVIFAALLW